MKKIIHYMLGAFLLSAGLVSCADPDSVDNVKFSGTLEMTEHSLGANVSGRLAAVNAKEGDPVAPGQLLASLERFDQAQKDYERLVQLQAGGGASLQDVEHAALARDDMKVVSPIDGIVLVKVREAGESVTAGAPVVIIGDRADMWVMVYVPEGMINRLSMGQAANVHFDGLKQTFSGHINFIAPKAEFTPRNVQTPEERATQTFAVKVRLDHPEEFLRPGVAADVYFEKQSHG